MRKNRKPRAPKPSTLVRHFGSQQKAADKLMVTQQCISHWVQTGHIPPRWVPYVRYVMGMDK